MYIAEVNGARDNGLSSVLCVPCARVVHVASGELLSSKVFLGRFPGTFLGCKRVREGFCPS